MSDPASRALAWRHGYHAAVCERIEPWAHGTVVRADDVPTYYEYNLARVEGPDPGLDAEALAAAAEPALAGLGHRRIEVEDTAAGERLAAGFAALGWVVERLAFLHRELPGPDLGGRHGAELRVEGFEASRPLRVAWQGESIWGDEEDFVLLEERVATLRGTRAAVGYLEGEPAGPRASPPTATPPRSRPSSASPSAAPAASAATSWPARWPRHTPAAPATR